MKQLIITHFLFFCGVLLYAQDTLKLEPSVRYKEDCKFTKNTITELQRSKELIILSKNRIKVEYCYYCGTERHSFGDIYEYMDDSTLTITDDYNPIEKWIFKRLPNNFGISRYAVHRSYEGVYESGTVTTLIPFKKIGKFTIADKYSKRILWTEEHSNYNQSTMWYKPIFDYPQAKIKGKIYTEETQVDKLPTFKDGKNLDEELSFYRTDLYYGEPLIILRSISFVVTKEGEVVNIKQERGNVDIYRHPQFIFKIMKAINASYQDLIPAQRKGKSVNYKYSIKINQTKPIEKD